MRTLAGLFLKFENDLKIYMEIQLIQKIRAEEILLTLQGRIIKTVSPW